MKITRLQDGKGSVSYATEWDARLARLVEDIVAAGAPSADGVVDVPDDLIFPSSIEPHPVKEIAAAGGKIVTLDFQVRAAADDSPENPTLVFRATDESEDRHGSVIRFGGWDWNWYMRTGEGVFLYCHDYEFPSIGKTVNINKLVTLKAHDFTVRYAIQQWNVNGLANWAELCYRLAKDNYMPQVSVGFIPKNAKPYTPQTLGIFGAAGDGIEFLEQEGLELSQVTVGSNRNAYGVKNAIRKGVCSENEVTASGLGSLLFNSRDVINLEELPAAIAALRDPALRLAAVSQLPPSAKTKGNMPPTPPPAEEDPKNPKTPKKPKKPAVPADDVTTYAHSKAIFGPGDPASPEGIKEIAALQAVIRQEYGALDVYLSAFRDADHDSLRTMMASAMSGCMWRIADLLYNIECWYGIPQDLGELVVISTEIGVAVEDAVGPVAQRSLISASIAKAFAPLGELRGIAIEAKFTGVSRRSFLITSPDVTLKTVRDVITRVGKVLSTANFNKLTQAMALIEEVLIDGGWDPAEIEDAEDAALNKLAEEITQRVAEPESEVVLLARAMGLE